MKKTEYLSLTIALFALIASGLSVYYQFFFKPTSLRIVIETFNLGSEKIDARYFLINDGQQNIGVRNLTIHVLNPNTNEEWYNYGDFSPAIKEPNKMLVHSYNYTHYIGQQDPEQRAIETYNLLMEINIVTNTAKLINHNIDLDVVQYDWEPGRLFYPCGYWVIDGITGEKIIEEVKQCDKIYHWGE